VFTSEEVAEASPDVKLREVFRLRRAPKRGNLGARSAMNVRRITKADFDRIVEVIDHWWGGPIGTFAHPIFFYELGEHALVVEQGSEMIGFLLGFPVAPKAEAKTGYVHLVGIHPDYRRRGVGRLLYDRFTQECVAAGCVRMKAITTPGNEGSIRFHVALGWNVQEIDDYAGPGRRRIVFTRTIGD
jgi:GNAT superfamily N-acetyltransferase